MRESLARECIRRLTLESRGWITEPLKVDGCAHSTNWPLARARFTVVPFWARVPGIPGPDDLGSFNTQPRVLGVLACAPLITIYAPYTRVMRKIRARSRAFS